MKVNQKKIEISSFKKLHIFCICKAEKLIFPFLNFFKCFEKHCLVIPRYFANSTYLSSFFRFFLQVFQVLSIKSPLFIFYIFVDKKSNKILQIKLFFSVEQNKNHPIGWLVNNII